MTEAAPTEITIDLDRKHRALRSGDRWAVQKRLPDGSYDLLEAWTGGRRSLYHWLELHHISPDRNAEQILARLPEATKFRERK